MPGDPVFGRILCNDESATKPRGAPVTCEVTGVLETDRHHGRAGTTFTVTHVHLSNDIASRVVSMDQRNGRFASGARGRRGSGRRVSSMRVHE